ncbi:MAG TPA: hypothetical protein VM529_10935 [Gemmata sp.]|jgi:hypothetical protein|nr:hypothetical protein [Gemmata sp.]
MTTALVVWLALGLTGFTAGQPKPIETAPYVEFDFSTLPLNGTGDCSFTLTVLTADKDLKYTAELKGPRKFDPEVTCAGYASSMRDSRFKAEVVEKTKLRVYGRMFNDKLIPATKGIVESPDLTKDELPRVKNPEVKG